MARCTCGRRAPHRRNKPLCTRRKSGSLASDLAESYVEDTIYTPPAKSSNWADAAGDISIPGCGCVIEVFSSLALLAAGFALYRRARQ